MSSPMFEVEDHQPMNVNSDGDGPETEPAKIVKTVCWSDGQNWPCDEGEKL